MNTIRNLASRAAAAYRNAGIRLTVDPRARRAVAIAAICLVAVSLHANPTQDVATKLKDSVTPWIKIGIRLMGGVLAIGGLVVGINGFTGQQEGFDKVSKIAAGFIGIALGLVCIANTDGVMAMLNLDSVFSVA